MIPMTYTNVPMSEWVEMDDPKIILILRAFQVSDHAPLDDSREVPISKQEFLDDQQWIISEASVKLGVPVKIKMLPNPDNEDNKRVHGYFMEVDHTKQNFGELTRPAPLGKAIVMRCNGEPLTNLAEICLTTHITTNIKLIKEGVAAAKGDTATLKKMDHVAKKRFSPLGLRVHWAWMRRAQIADHEEEWLFKMNLFFDGWGRGRDQVGFTSSLGSVSFPICMACGANKQEDKEI